MNHRNVISNKSLNKYRSKTYRTSLSRRLHSKKDAVHFVNERGFIFFWPIDDVELPSLWCAAAGDRPVPNNHDDPGHITWRWKDDLLGKNKWYYAKVLRRKSTIISLKMIPNFFALSNTIHQDVEEVRFLFRRGVISAEEKLIFEFLTNKGQLDTVTLREMLSRSFNGNNSRFNRALELLQRDFRIVPCGISNNGRWNYSFIYETMQKAFPEEIEDSKRINQITARLAIMKSYFRSVGAASQREIKKIFHWEENEIENVLQDYTTSGEILKSTLENGEHIYTIQELL